jgi:hypothetical protein
MPPLRSRNSEDNKIDIIQAGSTQNTASKNHEHSPDCKIGRPEADRWIFSQFEQNCSVSNGLDCEMENRRFEDIWNISSHTGGRTRIEAIGWVQIIAPRIL